MKTSETIGKLAEALAKAQADFGPLVKGNANPFFKSKYADLASVVDVIRAPLAENGICYIQTTDESSSTDTIIVETTLIHASGEWISGRLPMPIAKKDPQGYGSALTYARRYALQSMVGLAAEDDDAESAMNRTPAPKKPARPEPVAKQVTPTQEEIEFFRKVQGDIAEVSTDNGLEKYWKSINPSIKDTPLYPDYVNLFKSRKVELAEGKAA